MNLYVGCTSAEKSAEEEGNDNGKRWKRVGKTGELETMAQGRRGDLFPKTGRK